jgi:catechol 2,3-dioxygenase-like lactoylglutathione lyase family enzyme
MKRMHLHVSVPDLAQSIHFYETLFGAPPSVVKDDYAKWMLEDPRVNFAISARGRAAGVDHIGIQAESAEELAAISGRLKAAGAETFDEEAATCCYARSDKSWVADPAGVRWETFHTFGEATTYGEDAPPITLGATMLGATMLEGASCGPGGCAPAPLAETPAASKGCCS